MTNKQTAQTTSSTPWYNRVGGALVLSGLCLAAAFLVGSRAIYTGSLQQYFLAIVTLCVAINRAVYVVQLRKGRP